VLDEDAVRRNVAARGYRFVVPVERLTAETPAVASTKVMRVMLLPFRVLRSDADADFLAFAILAFAIPDAVGAAMVGLRGVVIRSPIAGARYTGEVLDLARIAREAEVDTILTGTIAREGSRVRVTSQLLEVPRGTLMWSGCSEVAFEDLFHLQDTIVARVLESLSVSLTPHDGAEDRRPVESPVYELYLRANRLLAAGIRGRQQLLVAKNLYQPALEHDRNYAPAWARLSRCHWLIGKASESAPEHLAKADESFKRALTINPNLLIAHSYHAQVEADLGRALPTMVRLFTLAQASPETPDLLRRSSRCAASAANGGHPRRQRARAGAGSAHLHERQPHVLASRRSRSSVHLQLGHVRPGCHDSCTVATS
jgi:TolB-like protein